MKFKIALRSYTKMVDKGTDSGMNVIIAKDQKGDQERPEYHLVAIDWPKESKYWNKKEKERAMKE